MSPELLELVRCPIDPTRETRLVAGRELVACQQCDVHFPVKQGLPVLIGTEAELPRGMTEISQLPCQRKANRRESRLG